MDSVLSEIADAPISVQAKKVAYELIIRILHNIVQAANRRDPGLHRYKWVKAQGGSALAEKVLSVSPLFRHLLEALGFRFTIGRPPHAFSGDEQEYLVLEDNISLDDLANGAHVLEAVVHSLHAVSQQSTGSELQERASLHSRSVLQSDTAPTCPSPETPSPTSSRCPAPGLPGGGRRPVDETLDQLRKEQQRRYAQRGLVGGSSGQPLAQEDNGTSRADGNGTDNSGSGSWWQKFGWGGSSTSDTRSQDRSTSSRRPPGNNRMMTLRDLPKQQRGG